MCEAYRLPLALWGALAALLTFAPAVAWYVASVWSPNLAHSALDLAANPAWYVACIGLASASLAIVALAIRRRTGAEMMSLCAIVALGAALNTAIAFGVAFRPSPQAYWEPTPVHDMTRFTRLFYAMHRVNSMGHSRAFARKSWRLDEYGVRPSSVSTAQTFVVLWEEYGLPFRCYRSPLGMNPEHGAEVLRRLEIVPLPFIANTLLYAMLILAAPRIPRWVVARYRRQEGRCVQCGYLLKGLSRCPECGAASALRPRSDGRHPS
jgi:hypothetical protein